MDAGKPACKLFPFTKTAPTLSCASFFIVPHNPARAAQAKIEMRPQGPREEACNEGHSPSQPGSSP